MIKMKEMNNLKLALMGRNFLIEKRSENEHILKSKRIENDLSFRFKEINDLEYFNEIINSKNLIKHHFPHLYEEGLFSPNVVFTTN